MAQLLARMERNDLITRTPDPSDGRSSHVSLTEHARRSLPEACVTLFQGNRDALHGFSDEEALQLVGYLTRLIDNLDRIAATPDPAPPTGG